MRINKLVIGDTFQFDQIQKDGKREYGSTLCRFTDKGVFDMATRRTHPHVDLNTEVRKMENVIKGHWRPV